MIVTWSCASNSEEGASAIRLHEMQLIFLRRIAICWITMDTVPQLTQMWKTSLKRLMLPAVNQRRQKVETGTPKIVMERVMTKKVITVMFAISQKTRTQTKIQTGI